MTTTDNGDSPLVQLEKGNEKSKRQDADLENPSISGPSSDIAPANQTAKNDSLANNSHSAPKRNREDEEVGDINVENIAMINNNGSHENETDNPKASHELDDDKAAAAAAPSQPTKKKRKTTKTTGAVAKKKAKSSQSNDSDELLKDDGDQTDKGSTTKRSRKKSQRRDIPPVLKSKYDALDALYDKTSVEETNLQQAQRALALAEQRLRHTEAALQSSRQAQNILEEQVLEMELQLDNDFTKHYNLLLQFRAEHGHVHVPHSHPLLGKWVRQQKRNRGLWLKKKQQHGGQKPWKLYFKALDRLGFVWDSVKDQWQSQFDKLLLYQQEHGHTCVPKTYSRDKPLGAWVHRQRYFYKLYHEGKPTQLTRERIDLFNSIGFSWSGDYRTPPAETQEPQQTKSRSGHKRTPSEDWDYHYHLLYEHKDQHGHTRVSALGDQLRNNQLRDWVAWQRKQYRLFQRNQPSILTNDRIQRMEAIGFDWIPRLKDIPKGRTGTKKDKETSFGDQINESNDNTKNTTSQTNNLSHIIINNNNNNNNNNEMRITLHGTGVNVTGGDNNAAVVGGQMEMNSNGNEPTVATNPAMGANDPFMPLPRNSVGNNQDMNTYDESAVAAAAAVMNLTDSVLGSQQSGLLFQAHQPNPPEPESAEAAAAMMMAYTNTRLPALQNSPQMQQQQAQQQQQQQQHFQYNL